MDPFNQFSWISLLLLVILLLLPFVVFRKRTKRGNHPPGPIQIPIIGNLHQLGDLPHRSLLLLSRKHGPLMYLKLGQVPTVVVSSARMAREVMKSHDLELCNRPSLIPQKKLSYNSLDVVFAPYGHNWREMRKVCIMELLSAKRIQSFGSLRDEMVRQMISFIAESSSSGKTVNLSEILLTLLNDVVCRAAFGRSYKGEDEEEKKRFHQVLEETRVLMGAFFVSDVLPWLGWVDSVSGLHGRLDKNFVELDCFYERVISEHLDPNKPKQDHEDFVDVLLRVKKDQNLTRDHMKAILMNILIGGTDTTTAVATWVMTELMKNPTAMNKVQEEVRRIVGSKGKVEETDLPHLEYFNFVVKESLRLHPPGPFLIPREAMQHCQIGGYDIFPKTRVLVNAVAIGLDPESWENPDEFLPERFDNVDIDYRGNNFELIPFGAGRRSCPGMDFGMITVRLALANLLYGFNWEFPGGMRKEDFSMEESFGITVQRRVPLTLVPVKLNL